MTDEEITETVRQAMPVLWERHNLPQCERILPDRTRCHRRATENVEGDLYCKEHADEEEDY